MKPHFIFPVILIFLVPLTAEIFPQENSECQLISSITNGPTEFVKVKDNITYFSNGTNLEIVDFTDPANPVEILKEPVEGITMDLELKDSNIYLASNNKEIWIMDISQPLNPPIMISKIKSYVPIVDLEIENNILYVLAWNEFEFYDISNPANPVSLGKKNFERNYKFFSVNGSYAYVVAFNDSLYVWDMNDLDNARLVKIQSVDISANNITINGNYAYVTSPFGLKVLDISDPLNPAILSSYSQGGNEFVISNNQGYLCTGGYSVHLFDATDPVNLIYENVIATEGPARHSAAENGKIYVAEDYQGVSVTDVSDLANPQFQGRFDTWGRTTDVIVEGNYLYLANGYDGLRILDITDPENPAAIGITAIDGRLEYFDKFGNEIYSCDNSYKKMKVIDVSNPDLPEVNAVCDVNSYMNDIAVTDSLIFIATRDSGVVILNRSDCSSKLSTFSNGAGIWTTLPHNNLLYLIDGNNMFYVIDISDPTNPVAMGNVDLQSTSLRMDIAGDTVFVAAYYNGCIAVDVSDPSNPVVIGNYKAGFNEMRDIKVSDGFAYVANGNNGLTVLNITNVDSIYQAAYYNTSFNAKGIDVKDNIAFVADNNGGIYILRNDASTDIKYENEYSPVNFYLAQNYPNPFNPTTTIKYSIPSPTVMPNSFRHLKDETPKQSVIDGQSDNLQVKLIVYDVLGRDVATLVNKKQTSGDYTVTFNTQSVERELPSGIYFYKLKVGDYTKVRKMVLLK